MHLNDDDLVLHYYGEMPSEEEARAATHLAACGECQDNYATLQRVMAFVDSAPAVDPAPGFERIAWARLEPALATARRGGWSSWFVVSPASMALAAGVLLLIGASFMAGRMTRTPVPAAGGAAQSAEKVRERILLVDLGEHLDRSQMVLVDIAASPQTVSQEDLDSVRRRIVSKELLFKVRVVSSQVRERQKAAIQERTTQRTIGS